MKFRVLILLFSVVYFSHICSASDYRWMVSVEGSGKKIPDDEFKFEVGEWSCLVDKASNSIKPKYELRSLKCRVGKGLQISSFVVCGYTEITRSVQDYGESHFNLEQTKDPSKFVSLSCGKKD